LFSQFDATNDGDDDESRYTEQSNISKRSQSLAELEDEQERRLDSTEDERTAAYNLQFQFRAPTKSFSSSNTFTRQEQLFQSEDHEAAERQRQIQEILAQDDAKWKEERRKKKMGVYADAQNGEELLRVEEVERLRIERGTSE